MKRNIHHYKYSLQLLLSALLLIGFNSVFAQGWEKTYGGQWQDRGYAITPSPDGGYVALGYSNSYTAGDNDVYAIKVDSVGNELWSKTYGGGGIDEGYYIEAIDGGYIIAGHTGGPTVTDINTYLLRIDEDGNEIWSQSYGDSLNQELLDMIITTDGGIVICGYSRNNGYLRKVDLDGNTLWVNNYNNSDSTEYKGVFALAAMPDNDIAILVNESTGEKLAILTPDGVRRWQRSIDIISILEGSNLAVTNDGGFIITEMDGRMIRLDPLGEELWARPYPFAVHTSLFGVGVTPTADGGFLLSSRQLVKIDDLGLPLWALNFREGNTIISRAFQTQATPDGGYIAVGLNQEVLNSDTDLALLKVDENGNLFSKFIIGNIFLDSLNNCMADAGEAALQRWVVKAEGLNTYYGISDTAGYYRINLDSGSYDVSVISQSPYLSACDSISTVQLDGSIDTIQLEQPVEVLTECPYLTVKLTANRLRRCFTNRYYLNYCNQGTLAAQDAYIILELDDSLSIDSAALPFTMLGNNNFRFELDELPVGYCGNFWVDVTVNCNSIFGQAHCSSAHIYPDSLCSPINPNWSGASIFVEANCDGDSTRFKIRNIGSGEMNAPLNYIVIEDVVMYMTQPFFLDSGESIDIALPANGSTYQIRAEQEPGHPGNNQPFAFIEGCGTNNGGTFSVGFINMFGNNDGDTFIDVDCRSNVGAYDPNDKQGFPKGFGANHLIEANTAIDYLIRFQNTGTDTAFRVVIRDTLSAHLQTESFVLDAASHPVELSIESDNVLKFTFDNIQLPDSNVNEAASHGFVRFRIAQRPDLPDGTIINNQAAIYFDFNKAIITNLTQHEIGTYFLQLVPTVDQSLPLVKIKSYPNPMHNSSNIIVEGYENQRLAFKLFDLQGRQVYQTNIDNGQLLFHRNQLSNGIYFYLLEQDGQPLSKGKLIIQ